MFKNFSIDTKAKRNSGFIRGIYLLSFLFLFNFQIKAQTEGELTYKFSVEQVSNIIEAKEVQHQLTQSSIGSSCYYVEDCNCFKLLSDSPISYNALYQTLSGAGYSLSEKVQVSDGSILVRNQTQISSDK